MSNWFFKQNKTKIGQFKLGGLVVPNDNQCWLDNDGYYTKSTEFDYPSIGQIHKKVRDTQANIIFAVTREQLPLYKRLKDALPDISAGVGVLADDSSNIVKLIADEYHVNFLLHNFWRIFEFLALFGHFSVFDRFCSIILFLACFWHIFLHTWLNLFFNGI